VLASDGRGLLWAGYVDGRVAMLDAKGVRLFGWAEGLALGAIKAIAAGRGADLWISGTDGMAAFHHGRFQALRATDPEVTRDVSGIVQDHDGGLWLNGATGVAHVTPEEVEAYERDPTHRVQAEVLNDEDGLVGRADPLRPLPTAVLGGDGRVFVETTQGAYWIDPRRIRRNPVAPLASVQAVVTADQGYPGADRVRLPRLTRNFQIIFTAASLTRPERVRFRYCLDGVDSGWQEAGNLRQAAYTNVPPGIHRFHLVAANEDGVWSPASTTITLDIPAAFYQTRWFDVGCFLVLIAAIGLLAQLRMSYVTARLEARLKERERIARELHDTLIQSALGLIVTFQALTLKLAREDPVRPLMERALELADQLLRDARERVAQLREAGHQGNLVDAIDKVGRDLFAGRSEQVSVIQTGKLRPLRAFAAEELFWIAREALSNIQQHAGAHRVEVELHFAREHLRLVIRDDGLGIVAQIHAHAAGRGHLGVDGMRERAQQIGARLDMLQNPAGTGVEVRVTVPAAAAYVRAMSRWRKIASHLAGLIGQQRSAKRV